MPIFDRYLVKLGITWRWLKRNGLDYTEEYNEYERLLKKKFGTGLASEDIDLSGAYLEGELSGVIINGASS